MTEPATFRLDTVDLALEFGWKVEHILCVDEFTKDGITIMVHYATDDSITGITRSRLDRADEIFSEGSPGKGERLRVWLTGRPSAAVVPSCTDLLKGLEIKFDGTNPWVPQEFVGGVKDATDRAFLHRILELVQANSKLPAMGDYCHLCFGQYPGGVVHVYPFMRRFPPYKFKMGTSGQLMIAGCWKSNFKGVTGHPGFAELAALLDLDHACSAPWVPVAGLDPNELWEVGERVSRAINV